jgi:hypothetical protein
MKTRRISREGVEVYRNIRKCGNAVKARSRAFWSDLEGFHAYINESGHAYLYEGQEIVCYLGTFPRPIDIDSILPELERRAWTYVNQIQWPKFEKLAA